MTSQRFSELIALFITEKLQTQLLSSADRQSAFIKSKSDPQKNVQSQYFFWFSIFLFSKFFICYKKFHNNNVNTLVEMKTTLKD